MCIRDRTKHANLLNIQDFLNRVEHIRVDYALITQALEHAALLLQMPQAQLFLKVARFNNAAGFFRRIRTVFTNSVQVEMCIRDRYDPEPGRLPFAAGCV